MAIRSGEDHDELVKVIDGNGKNASKNQKYSSEALWSEVRMLRSALELAHEQLEEKKSRIEQLETQVEKLKKGAWNTEDFLQARIRKLEKDIVDRDESIEKLKKQLVWLRKQKFGKKSEKERPEPSEAQESDLKNDKNKKGSGKKNRGQQPGTDGHGRTDHSNLPLLDEEELELSDCKCPDCGTEYRELSCTEDAEMLEMSFEIYRSLYRQHKYVSKCRCRGKQIVVAAARRLYPRTNIGNSLWVHLIVQKFLHAVPTNRTLKDLSLYGLSLAEGTVCGGLKIVNDLLADLESEIVKRCRAADLWNADETSWHVFDSEKTKWWLWLVASDDAVAYVLDHSRSSRVPGEFFAGSNGVLMTDRLASYKAIQEAVRKAWCWVHVRRDIYNLFIGSPKYKTWGKWWLTEIGTLFAFVEQRFRLWDTNKILGRVWDACQKRVEEQVARLKSRWESELGVSKLDEEQKKVLRSMKRHWPGLTMFVEDPRIPLHNNRAERLLRNSVLVRKNSYGSGAEWSGQLAARTFSILQTWLINGLDPQAMLLAYFNECAKTPGRAPPDLTDFLPWSMSDSRKQQFALPESYKRPG